MNIERLRCAQLENVAVLGVGVGQFKVYFAHARQFVSLLRGGMERRAASRLLYAFLNSAEGQAIRDSHGGDLISAMSKGSLDKMMYSYIHRGGCPSHFVNLDGMKAILGGIPGVDDGVKASLGELYEGYHRLSFSNPTPDQLAKEDMEEEVEEMFDGGYDDVHTLVSFRTLCELRSSYFVHEVEKKYIKDLAKEQMEKEKALLINDHLKENEKERSEKEKERSEKEKALLANEHLQKVAEYEARMKEMEIANLKMQIELSKAQSGRAFRDGGAASSSSGTSGRKRASTSQLETEDEEDEETSDSGPLLHCTARVSRDKSSIPGGSNPQARWLVAYDGDVELTFSRLSTELGVLSRMESARSGNRWFTLLRVKRVRFGQIARAMLAMGLPGSIWIEARLGCTTCVGMDAPLMDTQTTAGARILSYMAKRQWSRDGAAPGFPMVLVK